MAAETFALGVIVGAAVVIALQEFPASRENVRPSAPGPKSYPKPIQGKPR
jgi:hypothetical protein